MQSKSVNEVIAEIKRLKTERDAPVLVALDGRSGSGKSTLSKQIANKLGAAVIEGDDFYAGGTMAEWTNRSPKEKAELCIDWKRIRNEALVPLLAGKKASWHPFNWDTEVSLSDKVITRKPASVIILDGAYSSRPELSDLLDMTILVQLPDAVRRARLKGREGEEFMESWHPVWDEAEDYYFSHVRPLSSFDVIINQSH